MDFFCLFVCCVCVCVCVCVCFKEIKENLNEKKKVLARQLDEKEL